MLNLSRLGAVRCLFFKSEQYSLIEMPVQVGASVDKHGHVKAAHTRIQKVRVAKPPVAVRQSSLFDDEPEQKATKKSALDIASVANHAKAMGAIRGYLESSKLPGFAVMVDGDIQSMHSTVKRAVTWAEGNAPDSIVQKISVTDADKIEQTAKATPAAGIEFNLAPVDDHIPDSGQKVETSGGSSGGSGKPPPKKPPVTTGGDGEESQEENIEHGKDAMRKVVSIKDDVKHAMYRNGLGWVDFPFGYEGDKPNSKGRRKGAKGVSHIIEARMRKDGLTYDEAVAFLDNVVVCIAIGSHSESRYKDTKRNIEGTKSVVILNNVEVVLMRDDGSDAWLMTGYEKNEAEEEIPSVDSGEGGGSTGTTLAGPTPPRPGKGAEGEESIASDAQTINKGEPPPKDGDRNAEGLVFRDGRWHREDFGASKLDQLRTLVTKMGGIDVVAERLKKDPEQAELLIARFTEALGLPRESVLTELGLKTKIAPAKSAKKPLPEAIAASNPLSEDDPSSPDYRYRDTGYVAGSRKENAAISAALNLREAKKSGRRVNANEVDWEAIETNPREAKELITKSSLFGIVPWDDLKASGMEPGAGFLIDRVYSAIGTEPTEDSPQARKDYALGLQSLRERLEKCRSPNEVVDVIDELRDEYDGKMLTAEDSVEFERLQQEAKGLRTRLTELKAAQGVLYEEATRLRNESYAANHEVEKRQRRGWKVATELIDIKIDAGEVADASWKIWSDLLEKQRPLIGEIENAINTARFAMNGITVKSVLRNKTDNPLARAWAGMGERFIGVLKFRSSGSYRGMKSVGSEAFRNHAASAKAGKIKDWSWAESTGATRAPSIKKESVRFQLKVADRYERIGGRPIAPESTLALKEAFNLRDVQSGNWVLRDSVSAKFHVENTAAAFSDLADIFGVPDAYVSLNGRLAMAFGARGSGAKGWADGAPKAHYEPVQRVINLTKMGGGGSLGHEWAHALDNLVKEAATGEASSSEDFASQNPEILPPGELRDAFTAVRRALLDGNVKASETLSYSSRDVAMADYNINAARPSSVAQAIKDAGSSSAAIQAVDAYFSGRSLTPKVKKNIADWRRMSIAYFDRNPEGGKVSVKSGPGMSQFASDAADLDQGGKSYWSTTHEMFARAFQSYVEDNLSVMGRVMARSNPDKQTRAG